MNIAFIGFGGFGKAIATLLDTNGATYEYAGRNIRLNRHADVLFLTVPVQEMRQALLNNRHMISENTIVVNCCKGIEETSHMLPHQIVGSIIDSDNYFCLTGPSFANELTEKLPTVVTLGYKSSRKLEVIQRLLTTGYCKITATPDYQAAELAGAMKNVYAILCGYAHANGFGDNTTVRIILEAQSEIIHLSKAIGYSVSHPNMPAILGDLILTCSSKTSRNYTYGTTLAISTKNVLQSETVNVVVEGLHTSKSIAALSAQYDVEPLLALLTVELVNGTRLDKTTFETRLCGD